MKLILLLAVMLTLIGTVDAAITGQTIITNVTATNDTDRAINYTNSTLNISFTDSLGNNFTNITFPDGFNFSSLAIGHIETNVASGLLVTSANGTQRNINISYTQVSPSKLYFNFTQFVRTPSTAGTYNITVKTNASTTPVTISLYVRDDSKPYYVKSNNSALTVTSETFGSLTTTITTSGSGVSNLTVFAPNITTQRSMLVGWGATNVSKVEVNRTGASTVIYLTTLGTVTNPIIVLSSSTEFQATSMPAIIATGAAITGLTVIYLFRRRRH